jgi:hypothetical protein
VIGLDLRYEGGAADLGRIAARPLAPLAGTQGSAHLALLEQPEADPGKRDGCALLPPLHPCDAAPHLMRAVREPAQEGLGLLLGA